MYIQHQIQCRNSWYNFIYLACLLWNIFCVHIKHRKNENSIQHHTNIYKQSLALKPQYKDLVSIIGFHSSARHIPGSKKNTLKFNLKLSPHVCRNSLNVSNFRLTPCKEWIRCQCIWFWSPLLVGLGWMWSGCRHTESVQRNKNQWYSPLDVTIIINNDQWWSMWWGCRHTESTRGDTSSITVRNLTMERWLVAILNIISVINLLFGRAWKISGKWRIRLENLK